MSDTTESTDAEATDADTTDAAEAEAPAPEPDPNVVPITINGRAVDARKGELVIAAAERNGEYIPRFCYHPRMSSVGMCRQCLVEIDTGRGPMLQPSCMITVSPDMQVDTESETTKRAQEGIIELLLANHPLDCPVCDKGGECPLQDQAFSHGPGESRYVEQKRHYEKPIPISDLVLLDRERCILCDRCTRFADEVAGDKLIHFIHRGNATEVNTFPDDPFVSYFSGNVAQICPVGALTTTAYRFKARPWDLTQVDSTCTDCSVGCDISVHASRDQVLRRQGLGADDEHNAVNHGWLCDRGRFGFQAVESDQRITTPLRREGDGLVETNWSAALSDAAALIGAARDAGGPDTIAILGGSRGTNEDAFAWAALADALGIGRRSAQVGDGLPAGVLDLPRATIDDACSAPTVILLGPDLKEELGVLYLRLRDAAINQRSTKLIEFSATETGLSKYAWKSVRYTPGSAAAAVAETLGADDVAAQLSSGPVVVIAGRSNLAESQANAVAALQAVLAAAPSATVLPAFRRGNTVGALQLGLAPAEGDDELKILTDAAEGRIELLFLLGADPLADCPDADLARRALAGARRVISIDTFPTQSTRHADLVLPATEAHEQAGTTTNLEGRVRKLARSVTAPGTARDDWMIATELGLLLGHDLGFDSIESVTAAAGVVVGDILTRPVPALATAEEHRAAPSSYDYRLTVSRKMYDQATHTQMSPSLAPLAVPAAVHLHPLDLEKIGVQPGTEVKLTTGSGSVVLPAVATEALGRGAAWVPFNTEGPDVRELIDAAAPVTEARIEVLS